MPSGTFHLCLDPGPRLNKSRPRSGKVSSMLTNILLFVKMLSMLWRQTHSQGHKLVYNYCFVTVPLPIDCWPPWHAYNYNEHYFVLGQLHTLTYCCVLNASCGTKLRQSSNWHKRFVLFQKYSQTRSVVASRTFVANSSPVQPGHHHWSWSSRADWKVRSMRHSRCQRDVSSSQKGSSPLIGWSAF